MAGSLAQLPRFDGYLELSEFAKAKLLRTRKLARKNGGMGAALLVDFGSTTVFN